ncbi:amidohydrolase family protein [bacterium]|nr:amidohydrolase family protein [bacterium]
MQPRQPRTRMWARWGLDPAAGLIDGVYVEIMDGRYARIEACRKPPADVPEECRWPKGFLTPGLLNAHTHLDYSWLHGAMPRGVRFVEWLAGMALACRALDDESMRRAREACADAVEQALSCGTTEIWDVSTLNLARPMLESDRMRAISYAEIIAPTRARWEAEGRARLTQSKLASYISRPGGSCALGISPHTAYTVIPEALEACAHWANRRGVPLAIHLAETEDENELLINGNGELFDMIQELGAGELADELGIGESPIERARRAGALTPNCLAIHCNRPRPGEARVLAQSEVAVVFCPLGNAWFGRPDYPLEEYRQAGVRLALGTDSLASNDQLDIRLEAAEVARRYKIDDPLWLLGLATGAGLGNIPPLRRPRRAATQPPRPMGRLVQRRNPKTPDRRKNGSMLAQRINNLREVERELILVQNSSPKRRI